MRKPLAEDPRLVRLTELCLALPEAEWVLMGQQEEHASFTVRGKKFLYYLHDHHGDGVVGFCFKTEFGENAILLNSDPIRFYRPAYTGYRGWVGLRLDLGEIDWSEVAEFVTDSFRLTAPKRLA